MSALLQSQTAPGSELHGAVEPATSSDLPQMRALLEQHGLPVDSLHDRIPTTLVARVDGRLVGTAALEMFGATALLRSVAVDPALRGQGLGQLLTEAVLDLARQQGIRDIYLLTETATDFFPRFGFQPIARADVAPVVQQSVEFTTACPVSAQAMLRCLVLA